MNSSAPALQKEIRYEPDERPPNLVSLGLGFQLVLLSIGGIVLTPAIIIRAAGGEEAYMTWAVFAALCVCGLSTILQAVRIGRFGSGYVLLMGNVRRLYRCVGDGADGRGPGLLATLVVISSLFQFVLASICRCSGG